MTRTCPACGAAIPTDEAPCPDCGLAVCVEEGPPALADGVRFEDEAGSSFSAGGVPMDLRAGAEYSYRQVLALRVGSERLGGSENPFTVGAGVRISRFSFDYAYRNHAELDDVHRISGGIRF